MHLNKSESNRTFVDALKFEEDLDEDEESEGKLKEKITNEDGVNGDDNAGDNGDNNGVNVDDDDGEKERRCLLGEGSKEAPFFKDAMCQTNSFKHQSVILSNFHY